MTRQQIKRAKRLAEILGVDNLELINDRLLFVEKDGIESLVPVGEFNPEQDKALLWDLQLEYGAQVGSNFVIISTESNVVSKKVSSKNQLPAALIDCVIEINGGYDV